MTLRLVPPNQDENEEELRTREEEYQEQVKRWGLHDLADFRRVQLYPDCTWTKLLAAKSAFRRKSCPLFYLSCLSDTFIHDT
jgi:hypothetical protein